MLRLDDDHHAQRLEVLVDQVGDLLGQALLDLQAAGQAVHDPGDLAQPDDPSSLGNIGHVGHAGERKHVVLAHRIERDVLDQDHLVVLFVLDDPEVLFRVFVDPAQDFGEHAGHPLGRRLDPGPVRGLRRPLPG